jgi:hypothetical protein
MVKSPNNLQISVPLSIREQLQLMAVGNESVSLVAKRVLLEALGENSDSPSSSIAPDALEEIRDRLDSFDKQIGDLSSREWVQDNRDYIVKIMDEKGLLLIREHHETLKLLGDRLNQLEAGQPEFHESIGNLVERIENLEGWVVPFRKVEKLTNNLIDRLDALEAVNTKKPESQSNKGMTHTALAEKLGLDRSTVTRWRNDRAKWPEGYMWSDESKKWFPMEV